MKHLHPSRGTILALIFVLSALLIPACGGGGGGTNNQSIATLKGPSWQTFVGKEVVVEGYFVTDPMPMLVTSLDALKMNARIPEDQFILLTGDQLSKLNADEYGGANMRIDGTVNEVSPTQYSDEKIAVAITGYLQLNKKYIYNPKLAAIDIHHVFTLKSRYAVLFSGGINSGYNHVRYWNDLKFMYATLVNKYGFAPSTITVLYANGTGRDAGMPVDYSATQANLETAFTHLKEVSTDNDKIFFFTTNHGGGFFQTDAHPNWYGGRWDSAGDEGAEGILENSFGLDLNGDGDHTDSVSWDEELNAWGGDIYDDAFLTILDDGLHYQELIVVMEQCFSAGLILDMAQGGSNRILMAAAGQYEPSYAMPPDYSYDEFSYDFTSAVNGATPDGTAVDADTNDDGIVSMVEAFNYARSNDSQSETPHYEDSGDGVAHTGAMPSSGEGTLGDGVSLD